MPDKNYKSPSYTISGLDKVINGIVSFVFYYRLVFVIIFLGIVVLLGLNVYEFSEQYNDKIRNFVTVLTAGSIIIGIFYTILNYEYSQIKAKNDIKNVKGTLSFNVAFEWHKPNIVEQLKVTKKMYEENKHLIDENRSADFFKILEDNETARFGLVSILNYLECIAIGVEEGIMDEVFIKKFFKTLVIDYYNSYEFYINYRRKKHNAPNAWISFTNLASNWSNGN